MLYPRIEPFNSGWLEVSPGEKIYWEECGNSSGVPIVFVHGGPGAGCSETSRRFFDPLKYRVVLWDQRACGRSQSISPLHELTLEHMVQDLELLRQHLGINQWLIFGGSWGTTLALAYAKTHTPCVLGLLLRGVFLAGNAELAWLYEKGGASEIFPKEWELFTEILNPQTKAPGKNITETNRASDRNQMSRDRATWREHLSAYLSALQSPDPKIQQNAAFSWAHWEHSIMSVPGLPKLTQEDHERNRDMAIQSCHLFLNDTWLRDENRWMSFDEVQHLPCLIVQGQFDIVTPMRTAYALHQRWENSQLHQIPGAGHASSDPALMLALVKSLEDWPVQSISLVSL